MLALRIDETDPNSSLEYYVHEWIEAPGGVESKRKEIVAAVREQLARSSTGATSAGGGAALAPRPPVRLRPGATRSGCKSARRGRRTWGIAVAAVLVVAAVGLGLGLGLTRDDAASGAGMMGNHIAWTELSPRGRCRRPATRTRWRTIRPADG